MRRFGMDRVVNGVWLALYWAMEDQDSAAVVSIEELVLNWPFDFTLFEAPPDSPDASSVLEEKSSLP